MSWVAKYKSSNFSKNTFPKLNPKDIKQFPISKHILPDSLIVKHVKLILIKQKEFCDIESKFFTFFSMKFNLNNQSKKLHNWHELEFGDFIKELNNAIKKTGGEKLSKMDEMEWMEVFETKKAEVVSLKAEIEKTDKEIDRIVYELYELTPEEIEIVENS